MKRKLIQQVIRTQLSEMSIPELEKELGMKFRGEEPHVREMTIFYESQNRSEEMTDEEVKRFFLSLIEE